MTNIAADSLVRNDQVVINPDEFPYLVDVVEDTSGGGVRVTYSSGDVVEYEAGAEVSVVQCDDEGGDQEPPVPEAAPDLLAQIAELRGRFEDGYSADAIRSVFGRIYDAVGIYLVCVWDYADEYGFGGGSEFFAEDEDGNHFEVQPCIHQWLSGQQGTPGPVSTWVCAPVAEPIEALVGDDFHNYARTDRTGD